jgi:flagellar hook-associated protein 3
MEIADTKVDQISNDLIHIKELAIQAENGSYDQINKDTLADQVGKMYSEILDLANSQVNGKYIFAGFNDLTKPFVANEAGAIESQADQRAKELEIAPGETIEVSLSGENLFMGREDTDGDGYLENTGSAIFQEIQKTELAVRGFQGQIVDTSGTAIAESQYLNNDSESGIQRLVDGSGVPIYDDSGDEISLQHGGQPIYLTTLRDIDGNTVTIGDLENPEDYNLDSPGNDLTSAAMNKEVYLHKNGDIVRYDQNGDPILTDDAGNAVEKSAAAGGGYVALLDSGNQPMQMMYVPELTDQLDALDNALNQVSRYRGLMGNNAARVDRASLQLEESVNDMKETLSAYEDTDIIKAYSDLLQHETALQAALNVSSRVAKLSILNYM